jgi:hypothetical protein
VQKIEETMKRENKITPSDLRAEAARLIAANQMPDLETVLAAVASVRQNYRPKILDARQEAKIHVVK